LFFLHALLEKTMTFLVFSVFSSLRQEKNGLGYDEKDGSRE
jgi:hypothetical protein